MSLLGNLDGIGVHDVADKLYRTIRSIREAKDDHTVVGIHDTSGITGTRLGSVQEPRCDTPWATRAVTDQVVIARYDGAQRGLLF